MRGLPKRYTDARGRRNLGEQVARGDERGRFVVDELLDEPAASGIAARGELARAAHPLASPLKVATHDP